VAGIAAGSNPEKGEPRSGVAPEAEIIAVNVFSQWGVQISATESDILSALEWVYARRKDFPGRAIAAVNMSLGGYPYSAERCDGDLAAPIIDRLRKAGIATVIASGNDSLRYEVSAPSCISSAVTVGATDNSGKIAKFSNMSAYVDLMAPGVGVLSSVPDGWDSFSGTSMAAPHVAGALAALRSLDPKAGLKALTDRLRKEGEGVPDLRKGGYYEQPLIRVDRAAEHFAQETVTAAAGKPSVISVRIVPVAAAAPAE
jgi:subtilisin family serine protease